MSQRKLVCIDCKKVDFGDGIWRETDNPNIPEMTNALCPKCCQIRYPSFYSDYEQPSGHRFGISDVLSVLKKLYHN